MAESASVYIPQYPETERARELADQTNDSSILVPHPEDVPGGEARKAFSLARFIPLLADRIYVVSPFTRSYLVSWITVLDSVPELELITFLPEFLDGLLYVLFLHGCESTNQCNSKYLSDPTVDVRVATETVLADFLHEIQDVASVSRKHRERAKARKDAKAAANLTSEAEQPPDIILSPDEQSAFFKENDVESPEPDETIKKDDAGPETGSMFSIFFRLCSILTIIQCGYRDKACGLISQQSLKY